MNLEWLSWSNPVSFWWIFLLFISIVNIALWFFSFQYLRKKNKNQILNSPLLRSIIWFSFLYVFICAFRSILPRADVQRICLFDTWFSSVLIGRTVATIAELSFMIQWTIVLYNLGQLTASQWVRKAALVIVPLIAIAECFSWYAVISTNYIGNAIEESLWATTYVLVAFCLVQLFEKFKGALKYVAGVSILGCILYVFFMVFVDVPMYWTRWQQDTANGKVLLGFMEGLSDLNSNWKVTYDIQDWKEEIPWMSLYFSIAVWTSIALCYVPATRERLEKWLISASPTK